MATMHDDADLKRLEWAEMVSRFYNTPIPPDFDELLANADYQAGAAIVAQMIEAAAMHVVNCDDDNGELQAALEDNYLFNMELALRGINNAKSYGALDTDERITIARDSLRLSLKAVWLLVAAYERGHLLIGQEAVEQWLSTLQAAQS